MGVEAKECDKRLINNKINSINKRQAASAF